MNVRPIASWTLYKLRFVAAYGLLALFTGAMLSVSLTTIPPGLGPGEQQSVIDSAAISFTEPPTNVVDLPFHALQKLSVEWLGVTPLGVRLPSLVFGALTALCMTLVLRRWFKPNVAVAASFLIVVTAWFLSMARLGTPIIMIPFWTSFLFLAATYITQETRAWKLWRVIFALSAALALYTPYMAYLFMAALLAGIAQPHLRYLLRESTPVNLTIGGFFFIALLVPLGWGLYQNLAQANSLLAFPSNVPDLWQFAQGLWNAISGFVNPANISVGEAITPALGLSLVALGLIGMARLLRDIHSVRAHVLLIWSALLLPVVALNPANLAVLFVPSALVIAIGLNQIIRYWYRLFPLNPYARIFGLLPLAVLLVSIIQFNYQRYVFGMLYSSEATAVFNRDPFLVQSQLAKADQQQPMTVVVTDTNQPIYTIVVAKHSNATVANPGQLPTERQGTWLVADEVALDVSQKIKANVNTQLVTDTAQNARRFWVYQR